jgi:exosortase H (IPTLxxWG-CTERM-specific)
LKNRRRNSRRSAASPPAAGGAAENSGRPDATSWRTRGRAWLRNKGPVWRFGLKFGMLMGAYYLLVLTPFCDAWLYSYLRANAWLASGMLNLLGQDSHLSEITIRSAHFAITVRRGCDAIEPSWFFCAALLAFPAPWRRKLAGIVAGTLALQALNLLRIVSLYFIGLHYPAGFGPAHVEIWPVLFILAAISLWVGWIGWTKPPPESTPHAAS